MKKKQCLCLLVLLLLLAVCLLACGDGNTETVPEGLQKVDCRGLPYTVYTPLGWEAYRLEDHIEACVTSSVDARLTVYHAPCTVANVQAYYESMLPKLEAQYEKFSLVGVNMEDPDKPAPYMLGGDKGKEGIYFSYTGHVNGDEYRFLQFLVLEADENGGAGVIYMLTYAADVETANGTALYEKYEKEAFRVADHMMIHADKPADQETESEKAEGGRVTPKEYGQYYFVVPAGWREESYGNFAAAKHVQTGASVTVVAETVDVTTFPEYWEDVLGAVLSAYPQSQIPLNPEFEKEGATEESKLHRYAYQVSQLDGQKGERVDYVLVNGNRSYYVTKMIAYYDYHVYSMTVTLPTESYGDEAVRKALVEELCTSFRFE